MRFIHLIVQINHCKAAHARNDHRIRQRTWNKFQNSEALTILYSAVVLRISLKNISSASCFLYSVAMMQIKEISFVLYNLNVAGEWRVWCLGHSPTIVYDEHFFPYFTTTLFVST